MPARRNNAITEAEDIFAPIEAALLPLGFSRIGNVFHRRAGHDLLPRVEALTFGLEYGFRACWMHTTVEIPALVELLAKIRPAATRSA